GLLSGPALFLRLRNLLPGSSRHRPTMPREWNLGCLPSWATLVLAANRPPWTPSAPHNPFGLMSQVGQQLGSSIPQLGQALDNSLALTKPAFSLLAGVAKHAAEVF